MIHDPQLRRRIRQQAWPAEQHYFSAENPWLEGALFAFVLVVAVAVMFLAFN